MSQEPEFDSQGAVNGKAMSLFLMAAIGLGLLVQPIKDAFSSDNKKEIVVKSIVPPSDTVKILHPSQAADYASAGIFDFTPRPR